MAERGSNLPPVPDEGDLLAFIEGDLLAPSKRAAVEAYIAADPAMARRIAGMRRDMAELRAMADEPAPADLMAGVEAALQPVLERQALLGIADGQAVSDSPPISIVTPVRRSVVQAFFAERAGRRIALAAGLLLAVGVGTYVATTQLSGGGTGGNSLTIAKNDTTRGGAVPGGRDEGVEVASRPAPETHPEAMVKSLGAESGNAAGDASAAVAATNPPAAEPGNPETGAPAAVMAAADEPLEDLHGSLAELFDPLLAPLTGEQATSLLRQHRLVLRVKATDMSLLMNPDRVATRLAKSPAAGGWQVEGEAPRQLASLVSSPFPGVTPRARGPEPVVIVGDMAPGAVADAPQASYVGPAASLADLLPEGPKVYLLRARAEASALESLRASLNARGMSAEYEIAPEALPMDEGPALDAAAVLWWTQKPAGWASWGPVPVVVDVDRGG